MSANQIVVAEVAACVIEEMKEESRLDLGHSFVVRGRHPTRGNIVVFNSAEGHSAIVAI